MTHTLFIHISDWHLKEDMSISAIITANKIVEAIKKHECAKRAVIVFSGDIAFSGSDQQYDVATNVLRHITEKLEPQFEQILTLVVPGNHDVQITSNRTSLLELIENRYLTHDLASLLASGQEHFFKFFHRLYPDSVHWNNHAVFNSDVETDLGTTRIVLINSAICSTIDEKPGTLRLLLEALPQRDEGTQCLIAVMHHPPHWLTQSDRSHFNSWLSSTADIFLCGHEHEEDIIQLARKQAPTTLVLPAAAIEDCDQTLRGFRMFHLDARTCECVVTEFKEHEDGTYLSTGSVRQKISSPNERASQIKIEPDFYQFLNTLSLALRHKSGVEVHHDSVYVVPHIMTMPLATSLGDKRTETLEGKEVVKEVISGTPFLIVGNENLGKTGFLKHVFKEALSAELLPLYIDARLLKKRSIEEVVKDAIHEQYGLRDAGKFSMAEKRRKLLIVDDIDYMSSTDNGIDDLVDFAKLKFGGHIFSCRDMALLKDPLTNLDNKALWNLKVAQLLPFGKQKRLELVDRWVAHDMTLSPTERYEHSNKLAASLDELLTQKALPSHPFELTLVLESLDSPEQQNESTGAFGYHYQRIIFQSLSRFAFERSLAGNQTVPDDVVFEVLGRLAFLCWRSKAATFSKDGFVKMITELRDELLVEVAVVPTLETLVGARFIKEDQSGIFSFRHQYVFQYALAKLLQTWLNNDRYVEKVREYIDDLVENMHEETESGILMFFTFLTRDSHTIARLVDVAGSLFVDQVPSDFGPEIDKLCLTAAPALPPLVNDLLKNRQRAAIARDEHVDDGGAPPKIWATDKVSFSVLK